MTYYFFNADLKSYGEQSSLISHLRYLKTQGGSPDFWNSFDDDSESRAIVKAEESGRHLVVTDSNYDIVDEVNTPNWSLETFGVSRVKRNFSELSAILVYLLEKFPNLEYGCAELQDWRMSALQDEVVGILCTQRLFKIFQGDDLVVRVTPITKIVE